MSVAGRFFVVTTGTNQYQISSDNNVQKLEINVQVADDDDAGDGDDRRDQRYQTPPRVVLPTDEYKRRYGCYLLTVYPVQPCFPFRASPQNFVKFRLVCWRNSADKSRLSD